MKKLLLIAVITCIMSYRVDAAALTMTSSLGLTHTGNLVQNGSFENQASGGTVFYWATGTSLLPYEVPDNWSSVSGTAAYAQRANTYSSIGSGPLPDGVYGLYFGNRFITYIDQTPTFLANGQIQFTSPPNIVPDTAGPPNSYSPAVQLSQTISGLNNGHIYGLSFWASGEGARYASYLHDGLFGLDITGFNTEYLAVPSGAPGGLGVSHLYEFTFVPTTSSVTIKFTNWGHFAQGYSSGWTLAPNSSELVMDDVVINDLGVVPEPATLTMLGLGAIAAMKKRRT